MAIDIAFRKRAVKTLTTSIGVYVLCDLDQVPIYVGKSTDGIRRRVARHLTSARSDIVANRQIDVWEIAWVMAFPATRDDIPALEAKLIHHYNPKSALMNGTIPKLLPFPNALPQPSQIIQVMSESEVKEKLDPALRLPRQAERYSEIVNHFLAVKNSEQIARAMHAHFERLSRYHATMLRLATKDDESEE